MSKIHVVDHPLLRHSLTIIRDKTTNTDDFRRHTAIVSQIMIMEATKSLKTFPKRIETPLAPMDGHEIQKSIVFVPVLRAGISMLFPARDFLPWASVGFIGLERDEETAIAREYYQKFPPHLAEKLVLVLDPMLATGGSFADTISALKTKGAKTIKAVCIVVAPEGVAHLQQQHPDVDIYTAALDSHLNEKKYIVPGLGDFGDRYFGT
ncbi:MAG: uracil phosphoribosyltransferase [Gemmatimonadetes bacterium]|nr:MAG: uracil phosphoribosyltransferase [Gemmatimonadota bacterium]